MRRMLLSFAIIFLFFITLAGQPVDAQRFAQCDVCGYCQGMAKPPGSWKDCQKCMYEAVGAVEASTNKTLQVVDDPNSPYYNVQVTPKPGRYYTQVGCIQTDLGSFASQGASGSVVAVVMRIIFQITGGIAFLYLIYGAYVVITARGEPTALNRGRSIIFGAIIGLIFVMLITIILNLIGGGILKIPGFGATGQPTIANAAEPTGAVQTAAELPLNNNTTQEVIDKCINADISTNATCKALDSNKDGTVSVSEMEAWAKLHP